MQQEPRQACEDLPREGHQRVKISLISLRLEGGKLQWPIPSLDAATCVI